MSDVLVWLLSLLLIVAILAGVLLCRYLFQVNRDRWAGWLLHHEHQESLALARQSLASQGTAAPAAVPSSPAKRAAPGYVQPPPEDEAADDGPEFVRAKWDAGRRGRG